MSSRFGKRKERTEIPHFMDEKEIHRVLDSALNSLSPKEKEFCVKFNKKMAHLEKWVSGFRSEEENNSMVRIFVKRIVAACEINPRMRFHIVDLLANTEFLLWNSNSMCVELATRVDALKERMKILELENETLKKEAEVLRNSSSRFKRSVEVSADILRAQAAALERRAEQIQIGDVKE